MDRTELIHQMQDKPLQALVKKQVSSLLSKRHSEDGRSRNDSDKVDRLRKFSPVEFMSSYGVSLQSVLPAACKSVADAHFMEGAFSLGVIQEAYGYHLAHGFVKAQLIGVNDFVGVKSKMTDEQLDALATQILLERYYLNQYELILFCGRMRSGMYSEFYGSVDPMRILGFMAEFCSERMSDIDRYEREQARKAEAERESMRKVCTFEEFSRDFPEQARLLKI